MEIVLTFENCVLFMIIFFVAFTPLLGTYPLPWTSLQKIRTCLTISKAQLQVFNNYHENSIHNS